MRVIVEPPAGFCPGRLFLLFSRGQVVTMLIPCVLSTGSCHARHCSLLIVAQQAEKDDYSVRFLEIGKDVKPDSYDTLSRDEKLLIIIDDVHERTDVAEMIAGITRVSAKAKILLAMRPYGYSQLAYDLH